MHVRLKRSRNFVVRKNANKPKYKKIFLKNLSVSKKMKKERLIRMSEKRSIQRIFISD